MAITKKDFMRIAEVLKRTHASIETITAMAEYLGRTNALFDTERFMNASQDIGIDF